MKLLPTTILFLFLYNLNAQQHSNSFYKWEGLSKDGHIVYGVTHTKKEAENIIKDFNTRNEKTIYKLIFSSIKKHLIKGENNNLVNSFYKIYPKKYRVLRKLEVASIHIFKISNFDKAANYLAKSLKKTPKESEIYLQKLLKEYQLYRLEERGIK